MEVAEAPVLATVVRGVEEDPAAAAVADGLDGRDLAGMELELDAGPLAKGTSLDAVAVVDAAAVAADLDTALKEADLAAWEVETVVAVVDRLEGLAQDPAVVVVDHAARMGSMAEAASEDFADLPSDYRPSCFLRRVAAAQGLEEEDFASVLPIEDQEDRLPKHRAGRLVDVHLAAKAHLPGSADHLWVDPSEEQVAL